MDEQFNYSESAQSDPQHRINAEPPTDPGLAASAMAGQPGREDVPGAAEASKPVTDSNDTDASAVADEPAIAADPADNASVRMPGGPVKVQRADFGDLEGEAFTSPSGNIGLLLDVNLPVAIELGRTQMSIKDILELGNGSIVELDKLAGEPVDILVNDRPLAKGEVVVLDEHFGVRITSLVSPRERLENLGA